MKRSAGILMPIFSLSSKYGIGAFDSCAYEFVDMLEKSGQTYWQILPLGPTGYGDSPYQSFSTYAGNPYFISLEALIEDGLLQKEDCDSADFGDNENYVDYEKLYIERTRLLRKAYEKFDEKKFSGYNEFIQKHSNWLEDYALFMSLKNKFKQKPWSDWDEDIKHRGEWAIDKYKYELGDSINFYKFEQFLFYTQWEKLKKYANDKGIQIIGDIPIYVALDSVDAWANNSLFQFDENCEPISVAGCPPDGFSAKGQLWGNPVYNWEKHKSTDYEWWTRRIEHCFCLYDVVRIDHFRGFDEYYAIPYGAEDATEGEWEKGPGNELFEAIFKRLGKKEIIAEDLGFLTDSVKEMLQKSGFPGMKVLEFAFDARDEGCKNDYLPHNYTKNCVAYTGTHDNQTLSSWFETISKEEQNIARQYLCDNHTPTKELNLSFISLIMRSVADVCIIPIQDYLSLDDSARINEPSTLGDNWKWRISKKMLDAELIEKIKKTTTIYGRKRQ